LVSVNPVSIRKVLMVTREIYVARYTTALRLVMIRKVITYC